MFDKIFPALKIDIQNDDTSLSVQKSLLLQEQYYSLSMLDQANVEIDNKAMALLQCSGLIFALIGALQFPKIIYKPSLPVFLLVIASFLAFFIMVHLLIKVWSPGDYRMPGTENWDKMFTDYLWVDSDKCYVQILDNCTEAYSLMNISNRVKAKYLVMAMYLFLAQIFGLLLIALIPVQ